MGLVCDLDNSYLTIIGCINCAESRQYQLKPMGLPHNKISEIKKKEKQKGLLQWVK